MIGICLAVERAASAADRPFALGMPWHSEKDERDRVVSALVERAPVKAVAL